MVCFRRPTRGETSACLLMLALLTHGRDGPAQSVGVGAGSQTAPTAGASGGVTAVAHMVNVQEIRKRLGLVPEYVDFAGIESVKVAVLDYGFDGVGGGRSYLPNNTVVVEHYDPDFVRRQDLGDPEYRKPFEPMNRHGRIMAQIVWAVTGAHPGGPRFYLLNASGPTMLRRAVRYAIEQKVDIILFSGSFEGGGNGDGRGPINGIVDEALGANILWINAAGNFGRRVYNGPVRILSDGYLRLRNGSDVAALRFRNHLDENTVHVTLTWNDYRDEEDAGTDKDLDLDVENWAGRRVGTGEKTQISGARAPGPDESRNPRERVILNDLPASPIRDADPEYTYRIRVRSKSGRFTASDRIRILLTASRDIYLAPGGSGPREAVEFLDATGAGELYPPADHPLVLTVGDSAPDSAVGPTADRRVKPEVILEDSRTYFSDGQISAGSSNAAAYVAGVVALLKAAAPGLRMRHLLLLAQQGPTVPRARNQTATIATTRTQGLRIWRTPSRARLVETVREGR